MSAMANILYGGYEGTDAEVCLNAQSLGEALLNKLKASGNRIVLVNWFVHLSLLIILNGNKKIQFFFSFKNSKKKPKETFMYHRIRLQVDGISGEEISAHTLLSKAICVARYLQEKLAIKSGKFFR